MKNAKSTGGLVYSTNQELMSGLSAKEHIETLPPQQQNLRVWLDRKQRKGKIVTLITGFVGNESDLDGLARLLKTKCGVGGSSKDNEIVIQGDVRTKVMEILAKEGYRAKLAGG